MVSSVEAKQGYKFSPSERKKMINHIIKEESRSDSRSKKKRSRKVRVDKPPRGCTEQTTAKYVSRPSPPYPANECGGLRLIGNDGRIYVSQPNKNGVHTWKLSR
jgi:hypothetical protein